MHFECQKFQEYVMPATQSGSSGSLSATFIEQFDQVQEQAKSVFAAQKEFLDALETNQRALVRTRQIRS